MEAGSQDQVLGKFGLHDLLLDKFLEDMEIWRPAFLGVTICPYGFVLKGGDLSLELLIE